jgi:DNA-binding transcriptional MerR regulator
MKIGEVAGLAGVPASTIRYYERIDLLPEPKRIGGQRVYQPEVVEDLEVIGMAQELGFTLDEIRTLLNSFRSGEGPNQVCREMAEDKLEELGELVDKAIKMKRILEHGLTCTCTSLQGCYVAQRGSTS